MKAPKIPKYVWNKWGDKYTSHGLGKSGDGNTYIDFHSRTAGVMLLQPKELVRDLKKGDLLTHLPSVSEGIFGKRKRKK